MGFSQGMESRRFYSEWLKVSLSLPVALVEGGCTSVRSRSRRLSKYFHVTASNTNITVVRQPQTTLLTCQSNNTLQINLLLVNLLRKTCKLHAIVL